MIAFDYEKFQLKGCEWENFGVSDKWSFMGAAARFSKVPIINGPGKLSRFPLKIEISIVLHLTR